MKILRVGIIIICLFLMRSFVYAQNPADYLVLQSIGQYHYSSKAACGEGSGILGASDHFDENHNIITCRTEYYFMAQDVVVSIKVEQHAGDDSDKWLLHEVESGIRRGNYEESMNSSRFRNIDGNNVFYSGLGGGQYRWLSNNKVINIEYTDLNKKKPEPLEVIKLYLTKFPSTIPAMIINHAYNERWIKDEIERRLWFCDKWNMQLQLGKVTQTDMLTALVKNMKVFLNYRQKYFNVSAETDLVVLYTYLQANDSTSIEKKLTEYKTWWAKNKDKGIPWL